MMLKFTLALCLLFVLLMPTVALAQDTTPTPAPSQPFTATTQLDEAILWLIFVATSLWMWSVSVEGGIEVVKQRVLTYLPETTKELQKVAIVVGVLLLAYITMKQGGYSIFDNAPFTVDKTLADVLTAILLAVTAFNRHDSQQASKTIAALTGVIKQLAGQARDVVN